MITKMSANWRLPELLSSSRMSQWMESHFLLKILLCEMSSAHPMPGTAWWNSLSGQSRNSLRPGEVEAALAMNLWLWRASSWKGKWGEMADSGYMSSQSLAASLSGLW